MRWEKKGLIFAPQPHGLGDFSQSPQVLVCDDFIRIYFSSRKKDKNDKYLSYVHYVDMDESFKVKNVSLNPVIELGKIGCFDEHGIFPMNVLRVEDKILAYTNGWSRRASVSVESAIGFAVSEDGGKTFKRLGNGPILAPSVGEPFLVGDGFVIKQEDTYHMWYIFGEKWTNDQPPERVYKIAHATSFDGLEWKRDGKHIISEIFPDECQALPTVLKIGDIYHMYFCYRHATDFRVNKDRAYRLGHAISSNLSQWKRVNPDIEVSQDGWDSEMMCYPHLFAWKGKTYLLYNGNEFGKHGFGIAVLRDES